MKRKASSDNIDMKHPKNVKHIHLYDPYNIGDIPIQRQYTLEQVVHIINNREMQIKERSNHSVYSSYIS